MTDRLLDLDTRAPGSVHGCAGLAACQRCWLDLETGRRACGVIDLTPHRQLVLMAALRQTAAFVEQPRLSTIDAVERPHEQLDQSIIGMAAELGYRLFAGLDPQAVYQQAGKRGMYDAPGVDVKLVKARPGGWSSFYVNDDTWRIDQRDPDLTYVGVMVEGWKASIVGTITVADVDDAMRAGLVQRRDGHRRTGASGYYEVRTHLLREVS